MPWLQEQLRRDADSVSYLKDGCGKCMQDYSRETRQGLGCGWESPHANPSLVGPWVHEGFPGDRPETCVGYTTRLPDVVEAAIARMHWSNGGLTEFCEGKPQPALMRAIEILECAAAERSNWQPPKRGT